MADENPIPHAKILSGQVRIALYKLKVQLEKVQDEEKRAMMLKAFQQSYDATYELDDILTRYAPKG